VTVKPAIQINQIKTDLTQTNLYLEPTSSVPISSLAKLTQANIFIGPEGGFSEKDLQAFAQGNMTGVTLGPRILRTETAGLACISSLQSLFGDF
jgi:16S rRNA (uracil1498-N3)-methyltransferase